MYAFVVVTDIDVVNGRTLRERCVSEERVESFLLGLSDRVAVQQFTYDVFLTSQLRHDVHRLQTNTHLGWLGGVTVRASDLRSSGRGFDSRPRRYQAT